LAFGYYLENQSEAFEFTPADINNCYYEAKIESSNTSQMIIQNIRRGFMMLSKSKSDKGRKRYTLTSSGEKYIETKLTGGA
jgi:predicted transcriptional regulator